MDKAKDIKEELLKQMDGDSAKTTEVSETSSRKVIEEHKTQLRRRKWIAAISWLITFLYAVGIYNLKIYVLKHSIEDVFTREEFWLIRYSDMTMIVLIIISILLTYPVYAKSKTLTLLQICARLAGIEEQLKKMSQDKSPASGT
jgi:cytochrome b subunit of formate dehydrogenase